MDDNCSLSTWESIPFHHNFALFHLLCRSHADERWTCTKGKKEELQVILITSNQANWKEKQTKSEIKLQEGKANRKRMKIENHSENSLNIQDSQQELFQKVPIILLLENTQRQPHQRKWHLPSFLKQTFMQCKEELSCKQIHLQYVVRKSTLRYYHHRNSIKTENTSSPSNVNQEMIRLRLFCKIMSLSVNFKERCEKKRKWLLRSHSSSQFFSWLLLPQIHPWHVRTTNGNRLKQTQKEGFIQTITKRFHPNSDPSTKFDILQETISTVWKHENSLLTFETASL